LRASRRLKGSPNPVSEPVTKPVALAPGEGRSVENPAGGILTFKVMAAETRGAFTAIETTAAPGEGPPLHVHQDEDELIYILEGNFRIKLGGEMIAAPTGSCVLIPRGTPHAWQNVGNAQARFFATVTPASNAFEQFFIRYAELPPEERGTAAFERLATRSAALEVLGPPLAHSDPL
jgi:quercetin dioxygenase-like cupin family protein